MPAVRPAALFVGLLIVTSAACADGGDGADGRITVLAAASLTDVMTELAARYEASTDIDVELSFGPSSGLREQILAGAPADVYASADVDDMAVLADAGEVGDADVFATNRLEIAVPAGNPAGVESLADFARTELLVGLCAEQVPCGRLARLALDRAGIRAAPDTEATDVRALLTQVASGDLDAGIVYRTDVLAAAGEVIGIAIPDDDNVIARYPVAVVDPAGPGSAAAEDFVDFVRSPAAQGVLDAAGFGPASRSA